MPSFRNADKQAKYALKQVNAVGKAKHGAELPQQVHSVGTARNYQQALIRLARWLGEQKLGDLNSLTAQTAKQYLNDRKTKVKQSTLDQDRQAIQVCLTEKLDVVKSDLKTQLHSRAYTPLQVELIAEAQTKANALATKIAAASGLRAHELLTLREGAGETASTHRKWTNERFSGMQGIRYLVTGKGGLIREVMLPTQLDEELQAFKLIKKEKRTDRGIYYERYFNVGGGKAWSNSFTRASQRTLGWSRGAHGLRHSYAQERLQTLQNLGFLYEYALGIVSQELGHFRADITEVYLR